MSVIYKYPLRLESSQIIPLPKKRKILSVQKQGISVCVWAEVTPDLETEDVEFRIIGTGQNLPDISMKYVGTVQDGIFVWHVYEVLPG